MEDIEHISLKDAKKGNCGKIQESYVDFETAKLIKEKGFNETVSRIYSNTGEILTLHDFGIKDLSNKDCGNYPHWAFPIENVSSIISAPTQSLVMKWLREIHSFYISIEPNPNKEGLHDAHVRRNWWEHNWAGIGYTSYEDAVEAAVNYCLKNLL